MYCSPAGVRLQYIRLQLRGWISFLARRAVLFAAAALVLGGVIFACYVRLDSHGEQAVLTVALVIPGEQKELVQLSHLLQLMDSVRSTVSFTYPDEAQVEELFENREIQAAVFFAEDFYEDVNTGANTPVKVVLDEDFPQADLFRELISDMVTLVDVTEAASYAMNEAYDRESASMSMAEMQELVMDDNIALFFEIRNGVSIEVVSPTGEVDLAQYYAAILFLVYLLMPGPAFGSLYDPANRLAEEKLRIYGVSRVFRSGCKLVMMTAIEFLYALVGMEICRLICSHAGIAAARFDGDMALSLLLLAFLLSCFYDGILQLGGGRGERKIIVGLSVLILLIVGGCVFPCAYLPGVLSGLCRWSPFFLIREWLGAILFAGEASAAGIFLWAALFLAAGEWAGHWIGSNNASSSEYRASRRHFARALSMGNAKARCRKAALYLKWQWRRRTPAVITALGLVFSLLCAGTRFPEADGRTILLSGEEELCRSIQEDAAFRQAYRFVYEPDREVQREQVERGQALAAAELSDGGIQMIGNGISPELLVAKETVAAACYRYAQEELLTEQCARVFSDSEIRGGVVSTFEQYMQQKSLFHVEYQME